MNDSFTLSDIVFVYHVEQISENTFKAKVIRICQNKPDTLDNDYFAYGASKEIAVQNLKACVDSIFLFKSNEDIKLKDAFITLFFWIKAGGNRKKILVRALLSTLTFFIISLFFVNYKKGPAVFLDNLSFIIDTKAPANYADTGFLTEPFITGALHRSDSVFWACNVSFRTLRIGNKANLEKYLDKKREFKLILLDPKSPLAQDTFLRKFSRTAKNSDISATVNSLTNNQNGSLVLHGNPKNQFLYLSDFSPMIPMVRVDDTIFVSFPIHTDPGRNQSNYDRPYLRFSINSKIGRMLVDHFNNLLATSGTQAVFYQPK